MDQASTSSDGARTYLVQDLIDNQKISAFNLKLLIWSFIIMLIDGYDIYAVAFSGPSLLSYWHLEKAALAPVFSASLIGILIGSPLLGWLGDRMGRRLAIVVGCLICGVFTLWSAAAQSVTELTWLRLATGIGLGGIFPNTIALCAEMMPKRQRATMVTLIFLGVSAGGAIPGAIAAWLVPHYGWQLLYIVGGIAPLVVAGCVYWVMPESAKFLALSADRKTALAALIRQARPDIEQRPNDRFLAATPGENLATAADRSLTRLFSDGLAPITILIWLLFVLNLMTNYLVANWMPVLFESNGMSPADAAAANAMYQIGAVFGSLAISLLLRWFGFVGVAGLCLFACLAVAAIGLPHSTPAVIAIVTLAGLGCIGVQSGISTTVGLVYPTAVRSKGVGMAFAVGRFGSILGPLLGGALIQSGMSTQALFLAAAVPLGLGFLTALALTGVLSRHFGKNQLEKSEAVSA